MVNSEVNIQLLTVKEVMEKLQISRTLLSTLRKEGKIKAVLFGETVRFTQDEIARFIRESSQVEQK